MSEPIDRPSVRAVVLDESDRILLVLYDDDTPHWSTPGGAVEAAETFEQAARRELYEELGLADAGLRPLNWMRDKVMSWGGKTYRCPEWYFVTRVPGDLVVRLDEVDDWRWWSLSEIEEARASRTVIWPTQLEEHFRSYLAHGPPREPLDIGD